jgi:hypothetical protein
VITSVFGLTDWQFWAYGLVFIGFVWFVLRGLGYLWLRSVTTQRFLFFDWLIHQSLLIIIGLATFTVLGFIFAQLELRILQWLTIIIGLISGLVLQTQTVKSRRPLSLSEKITLALIGIGTCLQLVAIVGSGLRNGDQVRFYFTNAQDGMMHLAFAHSLVETFPPVRPELLNLPLTSYHYFTDLLLAEQARLLGIPIAHAFFQYWPIVLSLLAGGLIAATIRELTRDPKAQWVGIIIWYCSGELAYIWSLLLHQGFNWNVATIENSADQFLNMPQMFAKVLIFAAYYSALRWYREQHEKGWFFSALILMIISTGFKVYFGLFNLALALALLILGIITKHIAVVPKKQFVSALSSLFLPMILAIAATLAIFLTVSGQGSGLNWVPLAWPKLLLSSEHLDFNEWWLRLQVYEAANSWKGLTALNTIAVVIAITSMIGTKLIGLWQLRMTRLDWWWQLPTAAAIIGAITIGLNTLQSPGGFNTYNFIIVAIQPLVILTAVVLAPWWNRGLGWKLLVLIILLGGMLRPLANTSKYFGAQQSQRADAAYTMQQLKALAWVATNTPDTSSIQAVPTNQQNQQSAFISYFAQRPTLLAAENITVSHGLDYQSRQQILRQAFNVSSWQLLRDNLVQLGINYLYIDLARDQEFVMMIPDLLEHSIYQNETTAIIAL